MRRRNTEATIRQCAELIHAFAQLLAGLEVWNVFGRNDYLVTGFWVTSNPRRAVRQRKAAETAHLDSRALSEGVPDGIKNQSHREFGVARHEVREAR